VFEGEGIKVVKTHPDAPGVHVQAPAARVELTSILAIYSM
jgi:hypothetical protein